MNNIPFDPMTLLKSMELVTKDSLPEWYGAFAKAMEQREKSILASNGKMGFSLEDPLCKLIKTL